MKKILTFGTFDVLHPGHLNLFREAKRLGDHLTVVVARDRTVEAVKGRLPKMDEKERLKRVLKILEVDEAILGNKDDKYSIIEDIKPDMICLGYDQVSFTDRLEKELEKRGIKAEIIRLKPYKEHIYKSSILNS